MTKAHNKLWLDDKTKGTRETGTFQPSLARPYRERTVSLAWGANTGDSIHVGRGGAAFVDIVPEFPRPGTWLDVTVKLPSFLAAPDVRVLTFTRSSLYPTPGSELAGTFASNGSERTATVRVPLTAASKFVTLIVADKDTGSMAFFAGAWSVTYGGAPNLALDGRISTAIGGLAAPFDIGDPANGNDGNVSTGTGRSAYALWSGAGDFTWYWIIDLGARYRVTETQWYDYNGFDPTALWGSNDGQTWTSIAYTYTRISPIDTWWHINLTGNRPRMVFDAPQTYRYFRVAHNEYHAAGAFYVGSQIFYEWAILGDPRPR